MSSNAVQRQEHAPQRLFQLTPKRVAWLAVWVVGLLAAGFFTGSEVTETSQRLYNEGMRKADLLRDVELEEDVYLAQGRLYVIADAQALIVPGMHWAPAMVWVGGWMQVGGNGAGSQLHLLRLPPLTVLSLCRSLVHGRSEAKTWGWWFGFDSPQGEVVERRQCVKSIRAQSCA
jgi:hypothetical protein